MSSKEIKVALKAAKTSIQGKDYETALQHCDVILKKDGTNYNALVFAGLCYSETNQNVKARDKYRDAIKSQPDQLLAYQGFSNLYTKHWNRKKIRNKDELNELILIYEKLLASTDRKDSKKRLEFSSNLCDVFIDSGNLTRAFEVVQSELELVTDSEIKILLYQMMFKVLLNISEGWNDLKEYSDLIDEAFKSIIHSSTISSTEAMSYLSLYLRFQKNCSILSTNKVSELLDVCDALHKRYPEECLPMEILIQSYMQKCDHSNLTDIQNFLTKLEAAESDLAVIGKGYLEFTAGNFQKAFDFLKSGLVKFSNFLPGWIVLCKSASKLHKYDDVKQFARKSLIEHKQITTGVKPTWLLPIIPMDEIKFELSKSLAIGLCGSHIPEDVLEGIGTFEKLIDMRPRNISLLMGKAEGLIKQEKYSGSMTSLKKLIEIEPSNINAIAWKEYINFKIGDPETAITELESISSHTPLSLYILGKCMWEAGGQYRTDKKNCFTALVKAAKLDPHRSKIFLLLGHFYSKVQRDTTRAKGCYQKSYQLNSHNGEAASSLADAYVAEGEIESAISLYENITKNAGSGKWAWLRLGLYKLKAKDITNAIQCFQSALTIDSSDAICWECLGEGYLQRGSYTAAWKSFDKAHQLNPQSIYSLYQMAKLKQVQGLYSEAIQEYTGVLNLSPEFVPALQGIGESELSLSRQMFHDGRFQTGLERVGNAIKHLTMACHIRKDLCCLWKLLGDCCAMVQSLDGSVVTMKIPAVLVRKKGDVGDVEIGKTQLLILSSRFYCQSIQLQPDNASLWNDLGVSYYRQAEEKYRNGNPDATNFARKAVNTIKKAVVLESSNHLFWISLGIISGSKLINEPAFAQHCFLTSIKHEQNNVHAWSNLATLYLAHGHVKKSHEAFKVAQSLEPSFVNSWVGQAMIADTIGSSETMDLYRHSTELGLQKQGAAGYSYWVAQVIADSANRDSAIFKDNIRNMNAVTLATTQMSKICNRNPKCAWSSTLHGYLLENSGLNLSAEAAYIQAHKSLKNLSLKEKGTGEPNKDLSENLKKSTVNLARIFCKTGKYEEAISIYQEISENLDFNETCGLALVFYKSEKFEQALEAYKQARQSASSEKEKVQIMVAMAMVYWKMENQDEAKTLLYQCFQNCKSGLQALLSLGIVTGDTTLVGAAVGELMKQKSVNRDDITNDCLLIAASLKLRGDHKLALNEVQKALHENPSSWSLRVLLCRLLVDLDGCRGILSAPMISGRAEKIFNQRCLINPLHRESELWKSESRHKENVIVQECHTVSLLAGGTTNCRSSLSQQCKAKFLQAQVFAHMHPYEVSSWKMIACARHAMDVADWFEGKQPVDSKIVQTLVQLSSKVCMNEQHDITWNSRLVAWSKVLCSVSIDIDDTNPDTKFIHLLNAASKTRDKSKLQPILKDITTTLGITSTPELSNRYFGELLQHIGMHQVSRKMYEKSINLAIKNDISKQSIYFRIVQLAYINIVDNKDETKSKEWEEILKTAVAEFVKIDARSPQSLLFQAMAMRIEKNHRKSKSYLNRILNSSEIISDKTRSVAIWYLYRTLHERNDASEIEKLVERALDIEDESFSKIMEILPLS